MKLEFLHQGTEQRRELILHGSILQTLLMLSLPTLMMSVIQALLPLSDGLFINNAAGTLVASAVTYSEPVINMMISLAQGISVAAMAIIGQANGQGDFERVRHISAQIVIFASAVGLCAAPLSALAAFPVSANVDPEISHNVFLYISLYSFVLPFSFLESIYNAIKNATGKPEATFVRMLLLLALKILFNLLFIVLLRLEIVGCVLSSLCSNVLICVWMFYELFVGKGEDKLSLHGFHFDYDLIRQLIRVGIPAMLASLMLNLGFFLINNETQKYGAVVLNGQGIANNITAVCFNLPAAFGSAVTTMVSINIGAGQVSNAKRSCWVGCVASVVTALAIIAVIVPLSPYLTVLFTQKADVLDIANRALHIYTYSVVGFGVCMAVQGAFIGLGKTTVPLFLGVLRIWLLRYLFILATEQTLQYYSVFWGNLFSNYMAAVIAVLMILRVRWVSTLDK
ncbi:MATE family efflux transporter [Caproiciproducens sp. NJN-50]|uniref:MATE family efflux transporter n=1 Tax=Caproiciproducens sp. NJN-50 TaxID=2507162 RepID=UPI001FA98453|nr:MATE family efflux transporter [Caproiciproducens sp. NJN-50]